MIAIPSPKFIDKMLEQRPTHAATPRVASDYDCNLGGILRKEKSVRDAERGRLVFGDEPDRVGSRIDKTRDVARIEMIDHVEKAAIAIFLAGTRENTSIRLRIAGQNGTNFHRVSCACCASSAGTRARCKRRIAVAAGGSVLFGLLLHSPLRNSAGDERVIDVGSLWHRAAAITFTSALASPQDDRPATDLRRLGHRSSQICILLYDHYHGLIKRPSEDVHRPDAPLSIPDRVPNAGRMRERCNCERDHVEPFWARRRTAIGHRYPNDCAGNVANVVTMDQRA